MRVLTVRQPWAWAIIHGQKNVENRSRNIAGAYRGTVAIHAALTGASIDHRHRDLWPFDDRHVTGVIIGVVDLVDAHRDNTEPCNGRLRLGTCSEWAEPGTHHLVLARPRPLADPIPFKGGLGLRRLDEEMTARVLAGIGREDEDDEQ